MNTKAILTASAIILGIAGIAASFAPAEIARAAAPGTMPLIIQLLGAAYFAFAMANWMARGSLIGGIYNRPLALGNATHFVVGALALVKVTLGDPRLPLIVATVIYALFALAFTALLFTSPAARASTPPATPDRETL